MSVYNILDYIPPVEYAAIAAGTSTYDATSDINNLFASVAGAGDPHPMFNFPIGRICVSARLYPNMNNYIINGYGCEIFSLPSPLYPATFWLQGYNNGIFNGIRVNQNNTTAITGPLAESGMFILNCENIVLRDCQFVLTYGDGITIGGDGTSNPVNRSRIIRLDNVKTEANGRNGISFCGAYDILCTHVQAKGNNLNLPQSGFAFEPDYGLVNENINMVECSSQYNGEHGLYLVNANSGINIIGGRYQHNNGVGIKGTSMCSLVGGITLGSNVGGDTTPT